MPVVSPPTETERNLVRSALMTLEINEEERVTIWSNDDGTCAAQITDVYVEENSFADLFRALASILEGDA